MKIYIFFLLFGLLLVAFACSTRDDYSDVKPSSTSSRQNGQNPLSAFGQELKAGEYYATINGLRLRYYVRGKGPVCIVPTPGWGPSLEGYLYAFKPLEEYFTLVHLDTRGTGKSQRPASLDKYGLNDFVYDLEVFRLHLKQEKVWLMGHSAGGYLALAYGSAWPSNTQGLMVIGGFAGGDDFFLADQQQQMMKRHHQPWFAEAMQAFEKLKDPKLDSATVFNTLTGPYFNFNLHNVVNRDKVLNLLKLSTYSFHAYQGTSQSGYQNGYLFADPRYPEVPNLGRITVPTLVVVGEDDFLYPLESQAKRIHAGINKSDLLIIKNSGHVPFAEQPEAFFKDVSAWLEKKGIRKQLPNTYEPGLLPRYPL